MSLGQKDGWALDHLHSWRCKRWSPSAARSTQCSIPRLLNEGLDPRASSAVRRGTRLAPTTQRRMESIDPLSDDLLQLTRHYAERVAEGVGLPPWAASSFGPAELAVLGAIRDAAYKSSDGICSLTVSEIARLVDVSARTAVRAVTVAIAAGVIERDGTISSIAAFNIRLAELLRCRLSCTYAVWLGKPLRSRSSCFGNPSPNRPCG